MGVINAFNKLSYIDHFCILPLMNNEFAVYKANIAGCIDPDLDRGFGGSTRCLCVPRFIVRKCRN
jgi:hypothetical protein